jgi:hypothetical protein
MSFKSHRSGHSLTDGPFISPEQIQGWEDQRVQIRKEGAALAARMKQLDEADAALRELIASGNKLLAVTTSRSSKSHGREIGLLTGQPIKDEPLSWTDAMMSVVSAAQGPLTYNELRDRMQNGPSRGRTWTDKSFYGAMGKLDEKGQLIRHKGHVFSVAAYERFQMDIAAGRAKDFDAATPNRQPSALGKLMAGIVANQPIGLSSAHIIGIVRQNPEFAEAVEKNKTFAYNVLKSLVDKGEITKRDGLYFPIFNPPDPRFPPATIVDLPQYLIDWHARNPTDLDQFTGGITDEP